MQLTVSDEIPDPFFAALRRRHPDADVVLLPGAPPVDGGASPEAAADEVVAASLARVTLEARRLGAGLAPPETPDAVLASGARRGRVRAEVDGVSRRADGVEVLRRLEHLAAGDGWRTARPPGALARLEARSPDDALTLRVGFAPEHRTLVWSLRGPDLDVGPDRARRLTRAAVLTSTGGA